MFAAGRILRNTRQLPNAQPSGLLAPKRKRRKTNRKFRCYVPFMWSALMMTCVGTAIIFTGVAMCVIGYSIGSFAKARVVPVSGDHLELAVDNYNEIASMTTEMTAVVGRSSTMNASMVAAVAAAESSASIHQDYLTSKGLVYAGPVIMSFGCFAIVFACVVVCETRDRALQTIEDRVRRGLPEQPVGGLRPDFYKLVVQYRLTRLEKQRLRRCRQNAENLKGTVECEQLSKCDRDGGTTSGTKCERSSFDVEAGCGDIEQAAVEHVDGFSLKYEKPDGVMVDGRQGDVEHWRAAHLTETSQIKIEDETWHRGIDEHVRWNSVPSVTKDLELQTSLRSSLPMAVVKSRCVASNQATAPMLISNRVISGSEVKLPTAPIGSVHHRHPSASTSALVDASSRSSIAGNRKAPISTGVDTASIQTLPPTVHSPLDCPVTQDLSAVKSRSLLVHTAHVHATVDMNDEFVELDDVIEDCTRCNKTTDSKRVDNEIEFTEKMTSAAGHDDHANGNEDAVKDVMNYSNTNDKMGREPNRWNTNDGNMNVISLLDRSSREHTPLSQFPEQDLQRRPDGNSDQPIYQPIFDLKSYFEQPLPSMVKAISRQSQSLDELRCREPPSTASRLRRIFSARRADSGPTSLFDNLSNRFRRRHNDFLPVGARQEVLNCGGSELIAGVSDNTALVDRGRLDGVGESVPVTPDAVFAHEFNDLISSSWCDLHSDSVSSPRERNTSADLNRRTRHHSFSFTPRHYLARMRAWKAKRSSAPLTRSAPTAKLSNDISQIDGSTFINCARLQGHLDSEVTLRREAQCDGTHSRYQFPVVSFSSSKTRLHPTRGARFKRSISPVVSVLQAS